jgi:hypothetical protein
VEQHDRSPASVDLVVQPQPVDVSEGTRGVIQAGGDAAGRANSSAGESSSGDDRSRRAVEQTHTSPAEQTVLRLLPDTNAMPAASVPPIESTHS